ncbi:MAG: Very short patch repair protein [candidate division BRC1 bacterium ADurb.BinA364]|nr:MAG: Very short patch repair protein [candidate division BRC1 bacterium ADurb.BinA364]
MADTFSAEQRSEIMRRVRGRDTSAEWRLRRALWARGLRGYRIDSRRLPGRPDAAYSRWKLAIFVDGCFWHGCPDHCRMPNSNRAYWEAKIGRNIARDRRTDAELASMGWRVLRIWEHEVKADPAAAAMKAERALRRQKAILHSK